MTISSSVNNLSGCSLSRASTLSLVIWNPCSSDCHFSPCFQCLHTYAPLSFIWNKPWYCKCSCRLKASWHLILKTWDKHIVKLSRREKSLFYKNRLFFFTPLLASAIFHSLVIEWLSVLFLVPCIVYIQRREESRSLFLKWDFDF